MRGATLKKGPGDRSLTGSYSQDGKTQMRTAGTKGKRATSTKEQHGMTDSLPATETREVSQPLCTPGKNSVLSEPTRTLQSNQLDSPLRSTSSSNTSQLTQSKQLSGPKSSNKCHSIPDRRYYKPSTDTKTYYINSQGHLQSFSPIFGLVWEHPFKQWFAIGTKPHFANSEVFQLFGP